MSCNAANRDRSLEPMTDSTDKDDTFSFDTSDEPTIKSTLDVSSNYQKLNLTKRAANQRRPPSSMCGKDIKFEEIEFEQLRHVATETHTSTPNNIIKPMPLTGMGGPRMGMGMGISLSPADLKNAMNKRLTTVQPNIPKIEKEAEPIRFQLRPTKTRNALIEDKSDGKLLTVKSPDMEIEGRKNTIFGSLSPAVVRLRNTADTNEVKPNKDINERKSTLNPSSAQDSNERKTTFSGPSPVTSYKLRSTVIEKKPQPESNTNEDKSTLSTVKLRSTCFEKDTKKDSSEKSSISKQRIGNIEKNMNNTVPFPVVLRKTENNIFQKDANSSEAVKSTVTTNSSSNLQKEPQQENPAFMVKLRKTGQRETIQSTIGTESHQNSNITLRNVNKEPISTIPAASCRPNTTRFSESDSHFKTPSKFTNKITTFEKREDKATTPNKNLDYLSKDDNKSISEVRKLSHELHPQKDPFGTFNNTRCTSAVPVSQPDKTLKGDIISPSKPVEVIPDKGISDSSPKKEEDKDSSSLQCAKAVDASSSITTSDSLNLESSKSVNAFSEKPTPKASIKKEPSIDVKSARYSTVVDETVSHKNDDIFSCSSPKDKSVFSLQGSTPTSPIKEANKTIKNDVESDQFKSNQSRGRISSSACSTQVTSPTVEAKKSFRKQKSQSVTSSVQGSLNDNPIFKNNPFLKNNAEMVPKRANLTRSKPSKSYGNTDEVNSIRSRFKGALYTEESGSKYKVSSRNTKSETSSTANNTVVSSPSGSLTPTDKSCPSSPKATRIGNITDTSVSPLHSSTDSHKLSSIDQKGDKSVFASDKNEEKPLESKQPVRVLENVSTKDSARTGSNLNLEKLPNLIKEDCVSDTNSLGDTNAQKSLNDEPSLINQNLTESIDYQSKSTISKKRNRNDKETLESGVNIDGERLSKISKSKEDDNVQTVINTSSTSESVNTQITKSNGNCSKESTSEVDCIPSSSVTEVVDPNIDKKDDNCKDKKLVSIHPEQQHAIT